MKMNKIDAVTRSSRYRELAADARSEYLRVLLSSLKLALRNFARHISKLWNRNIFLKAANG